jgi:hypothetical protein
LPRDHRDLASKRQQKRSTMRDASTISAALKTIAGTKSQGINLFG